MSQHSEFSLFHVAFISVIAALGGFLMGFDASVISGVVKFIEPEFGLTKLQLGWAVASLTLTATFAMMVAGPLGDKFGRKALLKAAALLFLISAVMSAIAPNFLVLVLARMIGGFGVGAALIIAPMYIAEIAPAKYRGRLVSLNQLNIVVGISAAFFTNYLILQLGASTTPEQDNWNIQQWNWRWMLGLEAIPALLYFFCLNFVPESPRWLIFQQRTSEAKQVLAKTVPAAELKETLDNLEAGIQHSSSQQQGSFLALLKPNMRLVMIVGISIAILQQITGINAVFFYAPMIFEQSGFGTDASFMQAVLVGLTNLLFTVLAILLIDKIGRKALLLFGVSGIAICMALMAFQFGQASYQLDANSLSEVPLEISLQSQQVLTETTYEDDLQFKQALVTHLGKEQALIYESELIAASIQVNQKWVLISLLGFVACFAISLGPVMWVLFSELFPNRIRGIAISFVGLINSAVSFLVQLVFPWELATLGATFTFAFYAVFALLGLAIIMIYLPETKGKSLEQLEKILVR
ncbi:sugar porter family MFS transporter [Aliiglaciecola sp. 3_MG-2023]|uniref:sugar porter family MFS transporter n=1 Tax=Aliiglaciecola sp. 3_MG-2023 TaxID=3062644 RepID=UPI0026E12D92|nr:sugar porter family MFS transporter [Aliiglaciecola sp. 3_MG-2023]MDO6694133.1 sugar porter family MFS transporter [Aliiglaciecola sp. 3_MG-2023]